jgi:hypothetical protein
MIFIGLFSVLKKNYALIIDANWNPLSGLPPAQWFQTMVYLSIMWTALFCASAGTWVWYGELLVAHTLVAFGALITGLEFRTASLVKSYRDLLEDRTARYDDVWGA